MMNKKLIFFAKLMVLISLVSFSANKVYAEEESSISAVIESLRNDIKTLEKAVYSQDDKSNSTNLNLSDNEGDVLTQHLLKLSELEEQFKILTNQFEEVNFKLDKLSNRITKIQADNQIRFQDIEKSGLTQSLENLTTTKKKQLPGSDQPQDLGGVSDSDLATTQQTQSIESVGTVVTEKKERTDKILPDVSPEKQYEFATSFLKVGDYETAEYALRQFVEINPKHKLAGNAQFWYGETFKIRQLYTDAAAAYLEGYRKYPNSSKAPRNLLELGVMMVQIGEKQQGCKMILAVKKEYPEANQSIILKAEANKKKFSCEKKS